MEWGEIVLAVDAHVYRYPRDERDELARLLCAHADVPFLAVLRRLQRPLDELGRVVKAKKSVLVLDVVLRQQRVHFFELLRVAQIDV